jgi:mono/diheme cytochrome c family protein
MNTSKQINIIILMVFLAVIATGAYTLWDPSRADDAESTQLEKQTRYGAWVFSQNCRTCHGDSGEGGAASNRLRQAPALNRPQLQGREEADGPVDKTKKQQEFDLIVNTITCGRVGTAMPTWGQSQGGTLSALQIHQLALLITEGGEGWDVAKEFALEGVPAFDKHGDEFEGFSLAQPVGADDTEIVLNKWEALLVEGQRLMIDDNELVVINGDVAEGATTIPVERGLGTTSPADHEAGSSVIKQPSPPDPVSTVAASCGQTAKPAATPGPSEPPSAQLTIVAQGVAWSKTQLSALQDSPLTLLVDNQEADGTVHNIHFTQGADPGGDELTAAECAGVDGGCKTDITNEDVTLNFGPLPAGQYYYYCEVHPAMEGVLTASAPGAAAPGGANTPPAETPASAAP